jgi:tetratricopeptide (TPR) repeat protein
MNDELAVRKALMQADRGDHEAAKATLRQIVEADSDDSVARVRALVILGDLLSSQGDAQSAQPLLNEALSIAKRLGDSDDLLDQELMRARELLA